MEAKAMKAVQKLRKIFGRWKTIEIVFYLVSCATLITMAIIFRSDILPLISSLLGVTGVVLNIRAHKLCFLFLLLMAIVYGIVAFTQKYYGEAALNILYLVPTYAISLIKWARKREDFVTVEIFTASNKILLIMMLTGAVGIVGYGFVLSLTDASLPYLNAIGTFVCAGAAFLAARKMKEQWVFWILNNVVLIILWCMNLNMGTGNLPILIQNVLFMVMNIYGYRSWKNMQKYLNEEE